MAWTSPHTFIVGELVTAAQLNTNIRDNTNALLHPLALSGTLVTISNSAAETSIGSFTVPGNTMGANGTLDILYAGTIKHAHAGGDSMTVRLKFGGTTHLADSITFSQIENELYFELRVRVINLGLTSSQFLIADWSSPSGLTGTNQTTLATWQNPSTLYVAHALPAIDTTADRVFDATVQFSIASGSLELKRYLFHGQAASV